METKKSLIFGVLILLAAIMIFQFGLVSAQTSTVCAVHSSQGICQDVPLSEASPGSVTYSTSCINGPGQCAVGTCVTPQGTCSLSPLAACNPADGGKFFSTSPSNTPVCQQGCCIIGESSSLTTKAHCDALLSNYPGATENFRSDVTNEVQCLMLAYPNETGACVYSTSGGKTCKFGEQSECATIKKTFSDATFYKDYLCTNQNLQNQGVNCTKTRVTSCLTGKDPVYFMDSCGNPANIYDATRYTDQNYWNYVAGTNGVNPPAQVNLGSTSSSDPASVKNDGNCDSFAGSTCMPYTRGIDPTNAAIGDYVCRNLNCVSGPFVQQFQSQIGDKTPGRTLTTPVNGESWCARTDPTDPTKVIFGSNTGLTDSSGGSATLVSDLFKNETLPGSRDFVMGCYNGKIITEGCADYRNQICQQTNNSNGVYYAACAFNNWSSCYSQNSSKSCLAAGDCQWIIGQSILTDKKTGLPLVYDASKDMLVPMVDNKGGGTLGNKPDGIDDNGRLGASCVPKYSPGFDPSASSSESAKTSAVQTCNIASTNCFVNFTRGAVSSALGGGWKVDASSVTCLNDSGNLTDATGWVTNLTNLCFAIGDCGVSMNYILDNGSNSKSDLFTVWGNLTNSSS